MKNKAISLLIALAIPLLVGMLGSVFTQTSVGTWYVALEKPFFNPPNYVFPVAWTILYACMGFASWLVWVNRATTNGHRSALTWYGIQLFFNLMWSYWFFTLQNPGFALIWIIVLLLMITQTTRLFFRFSKPAGLLMLPYLGWVTFATVLNGSIWWLNS